MPYQVDQSNKLECSNDTAMALSNDQSYTIRIPAREKQKAISALLQRRKGKQRKRVILQLFAAALYYLLQKLPPGAQVIIDTEYAGHEGNIRSMVSHMMQRDRPDFDAGAVYFEPIGRKASAHKLALAVYRGERQPDKTIKADDLLKQIIGP